MNRREFEKWYSNNLGDLIRQPSGEAYIPEKAETAWQAWVESAKRQQERINELEAENPQVTCHKCKETGRASTCFPEADANECEVCDGNGVTSTVKSQEYKIKELEKTNRILVAKIDSLLQGSNEDWVDFARDKN